MRIAALSDLHVGPGGRAERFTHAEDAFLRWLDGLERTHDRIVVLGDAFETLRGPWPGGHRGQLDRARARLPRLAARFAAPPYHRVHGNHDHALAREGLPDRLVWDLDGRRYLFLHGHQVDPLGGPLAFAARLGSWVAGVATRFVGPWPVRFADRVDDLVGGVGADAARSRFVRNLLAIARRAGADVLVSGHSHLPAALTRDGVTYVNPGACLDGRLEHASIDTAAGTISVHAVGRSKPLAATTLPGA